MVNKLQYTMGEEKITRVAWTGLGLVLGPRPLGLGLGPGPRGRVPARGGKNGPLPGLGGLA